MKKLALVLLVSLLASCAKTQSGVSAGAIFTSWQDTISASVNNSVPVTKRGEACAMNVLGIVAVGDSSIEAAKKSGGIKDVAFADTNYTNVFFGVFQKGCTVVKGN
jgi:hypothetical protein